MQQNVCSFLDVQMSCQSDMLPDRRDIVAEGKVDVTNKTPQPSNNNKNKQKLPNKHQKTHHHTTEHPQTNTI